MIGALTPRKKEGIALAIELITHKPTQRGALGSEVHAKLAIRAGTTVKENVKSH